MAARRGHTVRQKPYCYRIASGVNESEFSGINRKGNIGRNTGSRSLFCKAANLIGEFRVGSQSLIHLSK